MSSLVERWLPVNGHDGEYEVSSYGKVRSLDRLIERAHKTTAHAVCLKGKLRVLSNNGSGYLVVGIGKKQKYVHRLVVEAFIAEIPHGYCVNHRNGRKDDNHVENLEIVTQKQNITHAIETGLMLRDGADNPACVHKVEDILFAYELVKAGHTLTYAAKQSGVSRSALKGVCCGKKWKYLGLPRIRGAGSKN